MLSTLNTITGGLPSCAPCCLNYPQNTDSYGKKYEWKYFDRHTLKWSNFAGHLLVALPIIAGVTLLLLRTIPGKPATAIKEAFKHRKAVVIPLTVLGSTVGLVSIIAGLVLRGYGCFAYTCKDGDF